MEINSINAATFAKAFLAGAGNLEAKKEWINELNVFPVPDGDTGTNMSMTILSAAKEVAALNNPDMKSLAKAISSGSLRGARGNSGVILSQLFRGFTKTIAEYDAITVEVMAKALEKAVETAYKAVMKPKEGTILTVARGAAAKGMELAETTSDLLVFTQEVVKEAERVLGKTPDMLPVLKQAGVVDSGGQGLVEVLKGGLMALQGKEVNFTVNGGEDRKVSDFDSSIEAQARQEIKFAYCTQFLIMLEKPFHNKKEKEFKSYLEEIGDSIVVVADDEIVKVHVHTNDPGLAMQKALSYGNLTTIIIENMKLERDEKISAMKEKEMQRNTMSSTEEPARGENSQGENPFHEPEKEMGFVTVSIGEGLNRIFTELGADYIIEGGQTMNPSTEDVLKAVEKVNARHVFVLPNNKNIILAANQAASICEDKIVTVIPTKTIPQGITAMINFIEEQSPEENEKRMTEEISLVKTGQVTYAVRDTEIDDKQIHEGDYMGIGDKTILSVGKDKKETAIEMIDQMIDEESGIVSVYFGEESGEEEAKELADYITGKYEDVEVEVHNGGQPIYYYIISVE